MRTDIALTAEQAAAFANESRAALADVLTERVLNRARWSVQDHPSVIRGSSGAFACLAYEMPTECRAKRLCEKAMAAGKVTWGHILLEEFAEAIGAGNDALRRAELVQVAAVALAWIECIDRRIEAGVPKSPSDCIASCGSGEPCDTSHCPLPEATAAGERAEPARAGQAASQPSPWRGWACQSPDRLPRLYGAREIAELNCWTDEGDRLFEVVEVQS